MLLARLMQQLSVDLKIVFSDGMHITKRVIATVKPYLHRTYGLHDGGVDIHSTGLFKYGGRAEVVFLRR
jgi:hypothetical protein